MIIATIGTSDFLMDSIEDAEALFKIMARSTAIDESYQLPRGRRYHKVPGESRIRIEIVEGEPMEYEEAQALIAEELGKRELKSA